MKKADNTKPYNVIWMLDYEDKDLLGHPSDRRIIQEERGDKEPNEGGISNLNYGAAYHPFTHFLSYITLEKGNYPEIGIWQTRGVSEQPSSADDDFIRYRLTNQTVPGSAGGSYDEQGPTWSADGRSIVYASSVDLGVLHLRKVDVNNVTQKPSGIPTSNLFTENSIEPNKGLGVYSPLWIKYRDLPTKNQVDGGCQDRISYAYIYECVGCQNIDAELQGSEPIIVPVRL